MFINDGILWCYYDAIYDVFQPKGVQSNVGLRQTKYSVISWPIFQQLSNDFVNWKLKADTPEKR